MKKITFLSILIMAIMLLAFLCPITSNAASKSITFEDDEVATQIKTLLGDKATISGNTVTVSDETAISNLKTIALNLSTCKSLKGLENFTSTETLVLTLKNDNLKLDLSPMNTMSLNLIRINGEKNYSVSVTGLSGLAKNNFKSESNNENHGLVFQNVIVDEDLIEEISKMNDLKTSSGTVWNSSKIAFYNTTINCTTSETADSDGNVKINLPTNLADAMRFYTGHKDVFKFDDGVTCTAMPEGKANLNLVDDDKNPSATLTAPFEALQSGDVKIVFGGLGSIGTLSVRPITNSTINFKYVKSTLKADVKKDPTTKDAEKVKVTITANKELDPDKTPDGWTLDEDGKTLTKDFDKNGKEDVRIVAKDGDETTVNVVVDNIKESNDFKVISKNDENQGNDKVKVTVTTNKELDPDKLPNGWTLGDDKKSVWKIMDKGATEEITLFAKDGSTLTYTVVAGGDKTQASTKIPQTGDKSTVIIAIVVVIAIGGIVFLAKSRKILK